ncbi:hypothetical protein RJ55_00140 [Drechmeria coniospora]|nr:hypothetical protein RJ55_00140 [Drechmeria coniospora]
MSAMPGRQLMKWDPVVHQDILIALFQHLNISSADMNKVLDDMHAKGYSFSESALRIPVRGWTEKSHEALLLAVLAEVRPNKAVLTQVSSRMQDQHIQKLRRGRNMSAGGGSVTPVKKRAVKESTSLKRKTPSKGYPKEECGGNVDDETNFTEFLKKEDSPDESEIMPPRKRIKKERDPVLDEDEEYGTNSGEV